jgi:(R,R)-butanediol dehydrogenase / meso-butanediol dehydrogenase / diacetyl reductase
MTTMKAAVLHGPGDLRIEEVGVPVPGPDEVLLRVRALGVCGTDAAEYAHGPSMMPVESAHPVTGHHGPMVIGHEFAGEVVDVGPGVDRAWTGRLLASCGAISCGRCWQCDRGRTNLCESYAAVGLHRDGAAAEFVAAPLACCEPADVVGLSPDAAALGQPMSIAVHAARRGRVARTDRAVLLGAGGIGAFITYVLAHQGVRVLVVDPDDARRRLATSLGAGAVAAPDADLTPGDLLDLLGGHPHVVFESSGSAPGLRAAMSALPAGGRLVLVGIQQRPVTLDLRRSTLREHEIIGTNAMARTPDFPDALRLVASRAEGWSDIAPTVLPLDQIVSGALAPMAAGVSPAVKVLIDPAAVERRVAQTVPGTAHLTDPNER